MIPSKWTILIRNEVLGSAHFRGTFNDETLAQVFVDAEASRSRSFVLFEVWTGAPQEPGKPTGYAKRGEA